MNYETSTHIEPEYTDTSTATAEGGWYYYVYDWPYVEEGTNDAVPDSFTHFFSALSIPISATERLINPGRLASGFR